MTAQPIPNKENSKYVLETKDLGIYYGNFRAVTSVNIPIRRHMITAIIGPSGCGKSTLLRAFNRMNELFTGTRIEGEVLFEGENLYDTAVDPVEVRYRIGMVFQKPNPFPKSIYENIAWGARIHGFKGNMDELVESCLRQSALWDEVKDKLNQSGLALSGGQQQLAPQQTITETLEFNTKSKDFSELRLVLPYAAVERIRFEGMQYRKDIGHRAVGKGR